LGTLTLEGEESRFSCSSGGDGVGSFGGGEGRGKLEVSGGIVII
jgi:hypothetical protein